MWNFIFRLACGSKKSANIVEATIICRTLDGPEAGVSNQVKDKTKANVGKFMIPSISLYNAYTRLKM